MKALQLLGRPGRSGWLAAASLALGALAVGWGGDLGGPALRAALALGAVGLAWSALARRGPGGEPGPLEVEARQVLARECGVALIRAGDRRLLLGFGPSGVTVLAEMKRDEDPR